jgi:hypothetical protein
MLFVVVLWAKVKLELYSSHVAMFAVSEGMFIGCMPAQLVIWESNQERSRHAARAVIAGWRCNFEGATGMNKGGHTMALHADDCCSCIILIMDVNSPMLVLVVKHACKQARSRLGRHAVAQWCACRMQLLSLVECSRCNVQNVLIYPSIST